MSTIKRELDILNKELPSTVKLVAVSKFNPIESIQEAYDAGQRLFGESRPQELAAKYPELPKDIEWHFIGNLQTNKLKMVLPYVSMVESVSSEKLLREIDKFAVKHNLKINILLEVHIAQEESKHGFSREEVLMLVEDMAKSSLNGVELCGLMGMATYTDNLAQIKEEFDSLHCIYKGIKDKYGENFPKFSELSIGMSGDYTIAIESGSTIVRIGTRIFGARNY